MKCHPDRLPPGADKSAHEARFKQVGQAYKVLKDPAARSQYDEELRHTRFERDESREDDSRRDQRAESRAGGAQAAEEARRRSKAHDDADRVFFESMLDMAFEMAARGFDAQRISAALVALGCPARMAAEVAELASTRSGATSRGESPPKPGGEHTTHALSGDLSGLPWVEAQPLYRAVVEGHHRHQPLSPRQFDELENRISKLRLTMLAVLLAGFGLVVLGLASGSAAESNKTFSLVGISIIAAAAFGYLIGICWTLVSSTGRRYISQRRANHYLRIFEAYHSGEKPQRVIDQMSLAGMFGSVFFLAYRRVQLVAYLLIALACGLPLALLFAIDQLDTSLPIAVSALLGAIAIPGFLLVCGNKIYFKHCRRLISEWLANKPSQRDISELRRRGGTSFVSMSVAILIAVLGTLPMASEVDRREVLAQAAERRAAEAAEAERARATFAAAERKAAQEREQAERERLANLAEDRRYRSTLAEVEHRYPFLNPDSPQANQQAINWVAARMRIHREQHPLATDALLRAIADLETALVQSRSRPTEITNQPAVQPSAKDPASPPPWSVVCSTWPSACRSN